MADNYSLVGANVYEQPPPPPPPPPPYHHNDSNDNESSFSSNTPQPGSGGQQMQHQLSVQPNMSNSAAYSGSSISSEGHVLPPPALKTHALSSSSSSASPASPSPSIHRNSSGLGRRQLGAMLRKNYLLKRRAWCQTCCECLAPLILTVLLLIGHRLAGNSSTTTPPTIYVNQTFDINDLVTNSAGLLNLVNIPGVDLSGITGAPTTGTSSSNPTDTSALFGGSTTGQSVSNLVRSLFGYRGPLPVPSFDLFVGAHNLLHDYLTQDGSSTLESVNRLSIADARYNVLVNLGKISFAPDTPEINRLVSQLKTNNAQFNSTFDRVYPTEQDAIDYALRDFTLDSTFTQQDPYKDRAWAVIVFDELDLISGQFDYSIRMNYSVIPSTKLTSQKFSKGYDDTYQRYILSGYMTLQLALEQALVDLIGSQPVGKGFAPPLSGLNGEYKNQSAIRSNFGSLLTAPMPVQATYVNPFYGNSGPFVGLILCMSLLYPVSKLIKSLVEDKESRMKETLKMMGLYNWVFVTSYGITYLVVFTVIAILQTLLLGVSVMSHSSKPLLFIYFWFFSISMMCLAFLISVFFSKAKLAGIVGPIISFAFVMPRYAFLTTEDDEQLGAKFLTCILSPTSFAFGMDQYMLYEGAEFGVTPKNAGDEPVSVSAMIAFIFFDSIAYAVLAWYFEQVLPNEYGTHHPAWFLFTKSYWLETTSHSTKNDSRVYQKMKDDATAMAVMQANEASAGNHHVEAVPASEALKARLIISHLHKVFTHGNSVFNWLWKACGRKQSKSKKTEVVAVRDLNLTMYEGQITCLLGHNGAGKTTTISMLTGLFAPTSGDCWINSLSIKDHMHEIRQNLGVCPQHNVLFDQMTVKEHLELIAVLKGTPSDQIAKAVSEKIAEVGLVAKTNVFSASLSGGMKRKLSVGMALIGDSNIVFLDEPTSGMDPYSRRSTWELLKRAKQGRVIVLTTHFMDEADLLGDRIAIVANGQLRAAGSALFLKNRFGVGYSLTMVYKREAAAAQQVQRSQAFMSPSPDGALVVAGNNNQQQQPPQQYLTQPLLLNSDRRLTPSPQPQAWSMQRIRSFIQQYVPAAVDLSDAAGEISFQLPLNAVSIFGSLFSALDDKKDEMGIAAYGVSMTTLEEVFIKIAHEEAFLGKEHGGVYVRDEVEDQAEKRSLNAIGSAVSGSSQAVSPSALIVPVQPKKVRVRRRKMKQPVALPSDGIEMSEMSHQEGREVAASALSRDQEESKEGDEYEYVTEDEASQNGLAVIEPGSAGVPLDTSSSPPAPSVMPNPPHGNSSSLKSNSIMPSAGDRSTRRIAPMHLQIRELIRKRILCATRDLLGRFFEVILPVGIVAVVLLILTIQFNPAGPSLVTGPETYQTTWKQPLTAETSTTTPPLNLATKTPAQSFSAARHLFAAPNTTQISYYPSYALSNNDTAGHPQDIKYGLLPIPLHENNSKTDWGMIYSLGLSSAATTLKPQVEQPFLINYYKNVNNSFNMSVALLDDILTHQGTRTASYVFNDTIRIFSPLSDASIQALQKTLVDAVLQQNSSNPTLNFSIPGITVPAVNLTNLNGTITINTTALADFLSGRVNTTVPIGGFNVSGQVNGSDLVLNLPSIFGATNAQTVSIPLNQFLNTTLTRINGTDTEFTFGGVTLNTTNIPGLDQNSTTLNLTQFIDALQQTFPNGTAVLITNQTIQGVTIPLNTIANLINTTDTTFLRNQLEQNTILGETLQPVTLLHNVTQFHAIPAFAAHLFRAKLTLMYNKFYLALNPDTAQLEDYDTSVPVYENRVSYTVRNHPLPLTTQGQLTIRAILAIFAALFVLVPFCYLPASFVIFLVKERSSKAKHLQLVSGVSPVSYWLSTYIFDMMNYFIVCIAVILVFLAYNNESFTGDAGTAVSTFMLFLFYGFAVVPMAYCMSFMFTNHTAAQVGISAILFVLGFVLTIGSFILSNIELTKSTNESLKPFYRLSPPYCLGEGMINLATRSLYGLIAGEKQTVWNWDILGRILVYLAVEAVGYFILTLLIEYSAPKRLYKLIVKRWSTKQNENALQVGHVKENMEKHEHAVVTRKLSFHEAGNGAASVGGPATGRVAQQEQQQQPQQSEMSDFNNPRHNNRDNSSIATQPSHQQFHGSPSHFPPIHQTPQQRRGGEGNSGGGQELGGVMEEEEKRSSTGHPDSPRSSYVNGNNNASPSVYTTSPPPVLVPRTNSMLRRRPSLIGVASGSFKDKNGQVMLEDEDVVYEKERVESGAADGDLIVIKHLRKTFGFDGTVTLPFMKSPIKLPGFSAAPMVAVRDLCLSVPAGQCFGFLGINGAGKTTTMSMLTGELEPDGGRAYLNGYDVVTQLEQVRQELGYCPQFDPLINELTSREHLVMYGRVRGIPEDRLHPLVQHLIDKLGLGPFADNISESYSGGTKRKLSLAIALIGDPSVVFLDEPSTGMDPVSRRFMWSIISELSKSMSIVLTTHSMEECEALCSRVGIMVNGGLACVGSLQHLKDVYGKGFQVEINTREDRMDDVRAFINQLFEGAEEQEHHAGRIKYLIPRQSSSGDRSEITLAQIFTRIESQKDALGISDYGVGGASLEQIFVSIARGQDQKQAEERANHNDARELKMRS